jgi:hypothetical protein
MKSLFKSLLYSFLLVTLVASCGLKYTPTETRESFFQKRQGKISDYILNQMNGQTLSYTSIAYGKTTVLKPISYKALDSLYELKYQNELKYIKDNRLEETINNQRQIALNDTAKVLYLENHVFSLGNADTITFYNTIFQLTSDSKISDVDIKQSIFLPAKYGELYRKYLFEESYLSAVNYASEQEKKFYQKYKDELENRSIAQQDAFVLHSLKLMEHSARIRTTSNRELLNELAIQLLPKITVNPTNVKISPIKESIVRSEIGAVSTTGFTVKINFSSIKNGVIKDNNEIQLLFNQFLELKEIIQL